MVGGNDVSLSSKLSYEEDGYKDVIFDTGESYNPSVTKFELY